MVNVSEIEEYRGVTARAPDSRMPSQPVLPGDMESGGWHWSQAADGSALLCLESVGRIGHDG